MHSELMPPPSAKSPPANPASVLVVDDEEPNRTLLKDLLEARGYAVREAENGAQALQSVAQQPPDLILLDVMMPGMDGFDVCRRLKQEPLTAPIPILMVTALSEREERLRGIQAGANDFLNKPIDLQDLTLRVANALYAKGLYDQLKVEQQKSELLLRNILPKAIAERMKRGETTIADHHPDATVLVADLVGFTTLLAQVSPQQVVFVLNEVFSEFDALVERFELEKIKTVGDAYIVAGGVNSPASRHTEAIAGLAFKMQAAILDFNAQNGTSLRMRMGISTGPLISGVIGCQRLAYDLWGEAVNLACHLEAAAPPGAILVDEPTCQRLQHAYCFSGPRIIELKNHTLATVHTLLPGASDQITRAHTCQSQRPEPIPAPLP